MAGFKCDLCGGQITMQANKIGVCKECGMEYDLEAIRAKMGTASKSVSQPSVASVAVQSSDEVDREALITYLNDVRVMETIVNKDNDFLYKLDEKEKQLVYKEAPPCYPMKSSPVNVELACENFKSQYKGLLVMGVILIPAIVGIFMIISYFNDLRKTKNNAIEQNDRYEKDKAKYDAEMAEYNRRKADAEKGLSIKRAELNKHQENAAYEIGAYKQLLQKAYSANIIPVQFRNIQGVYYLYDYLSTSNQTLSEALMQCNLEAIKQKLDKMIQLQSEQIVQQAITNAKLGKIYEVTEATMNNTAVAAKYAQIAAINSEVTKKLASSSLAYQKADFWLK